MKIVFKHSYFLIFAFNIFVCSFAIAQTQLSQANNSFAFELFNRASSEKNANIFFSPYSIATALNMTSAGAKGNTLKQMLKTLHAPKDLHTDSQQLAESIKSTKGYTLNVNNGIWAEKSLTYHKTFTDLVNKNYSSFFELVDFKHQPEPTRLLINKWISDKTEQKIKDLLPPDAIKGGETSYTNMVLTNTIYFNAKWKVKFQKDNTKVSSFIGADKSKYSTEFMNMTEHLQYYEDQNFQTLHLPYEGDDISMILILPKKARSLDRLKKLINAKYFDRLISKLKNSDNSKVYVSIPKFKHEKSLKLKPLLSAMGMPLAFTLQADFTGMREVKMDEALYIDEVYHKAFVAVDEDGTEAAAASSVVMAVFGSAPPQTIKEFIADHPFIYVIYHRGSGTILFLGRYSKP